MQENGWRPVPHLFRGITAAASLKYPYGDPQAGLAVDLFHQDHAGGTSGRERLANV
jgi:hypothetical protein